MMAVLADCLELAPKHYGVTLGYAQMPQDSTVYKTIQVADTVGLFQLNREHRCRHYLAHGRRALKISRSRSPSFDLVRSRGSS